MYIYIATAVRDIYPPREVVEDHVDNFVVFVLLHWLDAHFSLRHSRDPQRAPCDGRWIDIFRP